MDTDKPASIGCSCLTFAPFNSTNGGRHISRDAKQNQSQLKCGRQLDVSCTQDDITICYTLSPPLDWQFTVRTPDMQKIIVSPRSGDRASSQECMVKFSNNDIQGIEVPQTFCRKINVSMDNPPCGIRILRNQTTTTYQGSVLLFKHEEGKTNDHVQELPWSCSAENKGTKVDSHLIQRRQNSEWYLHSHFQSSEPIPAVEFAITNADGHPVSEVRWGSLIRMVCNLTNVYGPNRQVQQLVKTKKFIYYARAIVIPYSFANKRLPRTSRKNQVEQVADVSSASCLLNFFGLYASPSISVCKSTRSCLASDDARLVVGPIYDALYEHANECIQKLDTLSFKRNPMVREEIYAFSSACDGDNVTRKRPSLLKTFEGVAYGIGCFTDGLMSYNYTRSKLTVLPLGTSTVSFTPKLLLSSLKNELAAPMSCNTTEHCKTQNTEPAVQFHGSQADKRPSEFMITVKSIKLAVVKYNPRVEQRVDQSECLDMYRDYDREAADVLKSTQKSCPETGTLSCSPPNSDGKNAIPFMGSVYANNTLADCTTRTCEHTNFSENKSMYDIRYVDSCYNPANTLSKLMKTYSYMDALEYSENDFNSGCTNKNIKNGAQLKDIRSQDSRRENDKTSLSIEPSQCLYGTRGLATVRSCANFPGKTLPKMHNLDVHHVEVNDIVPSHLCTAYHTKLDFQDTPAQSLTCYKCVPSVLQPKDLKQLHYTDLEHI
ncbi:hypothetical protein CSKR_103515 [Clonorchis sinensis]|uniref:Uncharacterized protein n=1 Tax=Clonorchis sinensis TaxID=79923 RepID=A0A3R7EPG5_CLOSI|nr:hypothetical protein CSKR_103515 [Clonorchis sinensis]